MSTERFPLIIDGVDLPAPSSYKYTESNLVSNPTRNARGYASWDVIRQNVGSLDLTWKNCRGENIQKIIATIRNKKHFDVTFFNTYTGQVETRTFYSGDRSSELVKYVSALSYWATLTVPFVEV